MESEVKALHRKVYGHLPSQVGQAPGRIELLGGVSAAQEGLVLAAPVDDWVSLAISPRTDGRIELAWDNGRARRVFWLHTLDEGGGEEPELGWLKGMLSQLQRRRVHFSGFNATLHDPLPPGAGLGRTAARSVALSLALRKQFPFTLTELGADVPPRRDGRGRLPELTPREKRILARWCREAWTRKPQEGVEAFDPLPTLFGKAWHATAVDCRFETVHHFALVGQALVFCDTGVRQGVAQLDFLDTLARELDGAARALRAKSLRSVDQAFLKTNQARLTPRQHQCVYHLVGEIQRVVSVERALQVEDHLQAGYYLFLSHESAREHLGNSWREADQVVNLAKHIPGCVGARMTGRGLGGAVVCLVAYHQVVRFVETLAAHYREQTGRELRPRVLKIVDGVG